jgi:hypothetical protein
VFVAISSDDLWIVVKCQSNLEIAGSPRKVYRHRGKVCTSEVELLDGVARATELF